MEIGISSNGGIRHSRGGNTDGGSGGVGSIRTAQKKRHKDLHERVTTGQIDRRSLLHRNVSLTEPVQICQLFTRYRMKCPLNLIEKE